MVFQPLADLVRKHSDTYRPLRVCEVLDNAEWAASGPSFVQIKVTGDSRRAIYRDGPQPAIGSLLQAIQTGPDTAAMYLAFPLPLLTTCPGQLYVSGQSLTDSTWHILRCDLGVGNVWQHRSASPVSGSWDHRPIHATRGSRLFTWGRSADLATPGPLYYSDDAGTSWTACGIDVANISDLPAIGYLAACGGTDFYLSGDHGATWASATAPGGTLYDVDQGLDYQNMAVLTSDGAYWADYFGGDPLWFGPFTPGGPGWVFGSQFGGAYFTGGHVWNMFDNTPEPATDLGALAGDDTSVGRRFEHNRPSWHVASTGELYRQPESGEDYWSLRYDPASDHPQAVAGVGALDLHFVTDSAGGVELPNASDWVRWCGVLALADTTSGNTRYIAADGDDLTGSNPRPYTWTAIDARMASDLGDTYVASVKGLTSLDWWGYDSADPASVVLHSAVGGAKAIVTAPAGWESPAFDDSAWLATVLATGFSGIAGGALVAADATPSATAYFRQPFALGAGVTTATLHIAANDAGVAPIYVNGTAFYTGAPMFTTYDLDISGAIIPGATNLLAFGASAAVIGGTVTKVAYSVEAS